MNNTDDETLRIRTHLPLLAVSYLHGRGELFATSFARIDSGGFMKTERIRSSDPVFGVRVPLPHALEPGKRYLLSLRFSEAHVEYIVLGGRTIYERSADGSMLNIAFGGVEASMSKKQGTTLQLRVVAEEPEPLLYFVRDRQRARRVGVAKGAWRLSMQAESADRHCSEWPEVDDELELPLRIDVAVEPLPDGPEDVRAAVEYRLPAGLRFWRGPRLHHRIDTSKAARTEPARFERPAYATDDITIIENDDGYDVDREPAGGESNLLKELDDHLDLCDRYGVTAFHVTSFFTFIPDKPYIERLVERMRAGKGGSIRYLIFTLAGPPVEQELGEPLFRLFCERIGEMLRRLPDRIAVLRVMEITTNGQWPRPNAIPDFLLPHNVCDKDLYAMEHEMFPAAHAKQWQKWIDWVGCPERTEIAIQGDGPTAGPHWAKAGAAYFLAKNIWNFNTNVVQAVGRGFARAWKQPIGLAYDSHRGLDYETTTEVEVAHVYRSFFFAGMDKTMYEAPFVGTDANGRMRLTAAGAAFYDVMGWAMRHPRRGEEEVRIGFVKGSDDYGIRNPGPGPTRHGNRHRLLQHGHPAYRDWNLLDIVFPEYGNYEGSNPYRFVTGTPYGQADIVPFHAPSAHLQSFRTLVMLGKHRMSAETFAAYLDYAQSGGTLVLALEHLLDEKQTERKYAGLPWHRLIGAEPGEDVNLLPAGWDEYVPSATRFYNRLSRVNAGVEVVETLPNGDPLLLRHRTGTGCVYFYTSEFLTSVDEGSPRRLLSSLFAEHRPVRMHPSSDWVQYAVRRCNDTVLLAFMNHEQAGFPQGFGPKTGIWTGSVELTPAEFGLSGRDLEVFRLDADMTLQPVRFAWTGESLGFLLELDEWREIVIGPRGRTGALLFGETT